MWTFILSFVDLFCPNVKSVLYFFRPYSISCMMSDSTKKTITFTSRLGIKGHAMFTWNVWTQVFFYIINITEIQTREIHFTLSQLFFVYGFYTIFCLSIRMVKLIACANLSTTSRLVDHMCPARRYDSLMKLFSSVQYNNLINVYITLFLCRNCPNKYEPDKVLCRGLGYSLWSPFSF